MAEVPQTDPCRECPFRTDSLRGYTGPHAHISEIQAIINQDAKFPCHMRVSAIIERESRGDGDRKEAADQAFDLAPFCTGAIAYMNNSCKLVRHQSAKNYADKIGRRDDVFKNPMEMQVYHHGVDDVRTVPSGFFVPRDVVEAFLQKAKSKVKPLEPPKPEKKKRNGSGNPKKAKTKPQTPRVRSNQVVQKRKR